MRNVKQSIHADSFYVLRWEWIPLEILFSEMPKFMNDKTSGKQTQLILLCVEKCGRFVIPLRSVGFKIPYWYI